MLLDSESLNDPLTIHDSKDQFYGILPNIKNTYVKDIFVTINEIITQDDIYGFTDSTNVTEFLSFTKGTDY
jgi:hypothetical protein